MSPYVDNPAMPDQPRIEWPTTYLGRLQAVTTALRNSTAPESADALAKRFEGVTTEQMEAILGALVLFGRVQKTSGLYEALGEH